MHENLYTKFVIGTHLPDKHPFKDFIIDLESGVDNFFKWIRAIRLLYVVYIMLCPSPLFCFLLTVFHTTLKTWPFLSFPNSPSVFPRCFYKNYSVFSLVTFDWRINGETGPNSYFLGSMR